MSAKKENEYETAVKLYDKLVATIPDVERKGDTVPYTSLNGNMFSNLNKDGFLSLRLPEGTREDFLKKYKANLAVEYGIVRKEYVHIPDELLKKTAELKKYFALSYESAKTLKAKPTKKPANAGKKK